jgi:hypothetical protein
MRLLDGFSRAGAVRLTGVLFASLVVAGACLGASTALASGVWSAPTAIESEHLGLYSVSCSSATFCAALGGKDAVTYNGTSWSAPTKIGGAYYIVVSVACPSATFCVAPAANGNGADALTYNGTSWSATTLVVGFFGAVSCPSATFCVALGGPSNGHDTDALTYNGTSWSAPTQIIDGNGALGSVSCPSTTFCVAIAFGVNIGNGASALTYNGTSWSAPTKIDDDVTGGHSIDSLSCPSATFCVAVDGNGNALTYNGASWTAPTQIDGGNGALESVSCPSATFCVAVDGNGNALTYNGTSWSAPTKIDGVGGFRAVSCPSATFCVAAGFDRQGGIALTYTTATAPKHAGRPIINGKDKEKSTLTASNGAWTGAAPITYKYQWEVCNAKAKECQAIRGATKNTFTITAKYVGSRIAVAVTATDSVGSAKALSKATPVIEK